MEKRTFERFSVNLKARLFYGNIVYTGIVTNLSQNGMFICTKMNFPLDAVLMAVIRTDGDTFSLPVKIKRLVKSYSVHENNVSGVGVGLLNTPKEYIRYINSRKAAV